MSIRVSGVNDPTLDSIICTILHKGTARVSDACLARAQARGLVEETLGAERGSALRDSQERLSGRIVVRDFR
jgi:hypothetical protein